MPSRNKSREKRYTSGLEIQKRAECLLKALLDNADEARKFGNGFKQEGIEVQFLKSELNETGLKFKVKRNLLANLSGIKTENLNKKEKKNLYDKVRSVVSCLNKLEIISYYHAEYSGWWELILPDSDKNKLFKKLPALAKDEEALAKPHQELREVVEPSASNLSSARGVDNSQLLELLEARIQNIVEVRMQKLDKIDGGVF